MNHDFTEYQKVATNMTKISDGLTASINPAILETMKKLSASLRESSFPTSAASAAMSIMAQRIHDMTDTTLPIAAALEALNKKLDFTNFASTDALQAIVVSDKLSDILKNSTDVFNSFSESQEDDDVDDYVVIPEKSVKEINIPDTIAIPIGNLKIRISTTNFIALIGLLISVFVFASDHIDSNQSAKASAEFYAEQNRLDEECNQYLEELLKLADYSNSSLREDFEDAHSAFQDSGVSPDSAQNLTDNTTESLNTASEN